MNTTFQKTQYNGFKLDGTLMSRLQFSGIIRLTDISQRFFQRGNELIPYWSLSDEYGARLSCWNEELVNSLILMELYEVHGEIKIGKGGTFLNLKRAVVFCGSNFIPINEETEHENIKNTNLN